MCQAFDAEREFVIRWEQRCGRCKHGHIRFFDGMCVQGRLCPENDSYFSAKALRIVAGHSARLKLLAKG